MLLTALLGWLQREQRNVIAFLREENRALKAQLAGAGCGSTMRNGDASRRRQRVGRGVLREWRRSFG